MCGPFHAYYGCSNCKKAYEWKNRDKGVQKPCPKCRTMNSPFDEVSTFWQRNCNRNFFLFLLKLFNYSTVNIFRATHRQVKHRKMFAIDAWTEYYAVKVHPRMKRKIKPKWPHNPNIHSIYSFIWQNCLFTIKTGFLITSNGFQFLFLNFAFCSILSTFSTFSFRLGK